jgi:hypothetical protein
MSIDVALRTFVLADATVAGRVGTRMHARRLPQSPTLPALTWYNVSTRREHDMDGPDGLPRVRIQVSCWAATPAAADELAAAVQARLDGYRGAWGDVQVGACLMVGERDMDDVEAGRSGVALDFQVQYEE